MSRDTSTKSRGHRRKGYQEVIGRMSRDTILIQEAIGEKVGH